MPNRSAAVKAKKSAAKRPPAKPVKRPVVSAPKAKTASKPAPAPAAKPAKPAKSGQHLSKAELNHFRSLLLEKRHEILGDVGTMESEAFKSGSNLSTMPIHMADVGTDNFEQEFTLGLIESERKILREIQEALGRIEEGTYGICQGTGKPIPKVRLEAAPWAKYTLDYQKGLESGAIRLDTSSSNSDDSSDDDED